MRLGGLLFMDCGPDPGIAPPSKLFGIRAGADFVVVSSFVATRCGKKSVSASGYANQLGSKGLKRHS